MKKRRNLTTYSLIPQMTDPKFALLKQKVVYWENLSLTNGYISLKIRGFKKHSDF